MTFKGKQMGVCVCGIICLFSLISRWLLIPSAMLSSWTGYWHWGPEGWLLACSLVRFLRGCLPPQCFLTSMGEAIQSFEVHCHHQYADDTQLSSFTSAGDAVWWVLQCCLDSMLQWTRAHRLKLNPDKTEVLLLVG